jgi:hypothetical protein
VLEALSRNEIVDINWKKPETAQIINSTIFPSIECVAMLSRIEKISDSEYTSLKGTPLAPKNSVFRKQHTIVK